jgi:hypothetical protein
VGGATKEGEMLTSDLVDVMRLRVALAIGATVLLLGTGIARAKDAETPVSDCLKAHPPNVERVTPTSARVTYQYHDDCWYPAKSWLVVKTGGESRSEGVIFTKSTGNSWFTQTIELKNLKSNSFFVVKSAVEYFGVARESSEVHFETTYRRPTDFFFRALSEDYRENPSILVEFEASSFPQNPHQDLTPYGNITVAVFTTVNGKPYDPVTLRLESCGIGYTDVPPHGHRAGLCYWRANLQHFTRGEQIKMQIRYLNTTYDPAFSDAVVYLKPIEFTAGYGGGSTRQTL